MHAFILGCATLLLMTGCGRPESTKLQGYIEGEFVYVASPHPGRVEKLHVTRGMEVKPGDPLFDLENVVEVAAMEESERRLLQAKAALEDARKGLRPSEIEAILARLKKAAVALEYSERELARQEKLFKTAGATTEQELDKARTARNTDREQVAQAEAELETARLGARPDLVNAAEANMQALEAALRKAEWDLAQKQQTATQAGVVFDLLFREGEWVAAARPVVVLLPPGQIKLRTFVPEERLSGIRIGDPVQVYIDRATAPVTAKIRFISPRAEYTPPVIYSRENRRKFVFMVEAVFEPDAAARLHPGQPVDVELKRTAAP